MSDLRERVARLYIDKWGLSDYWLADAAIDLVLEEAAKVADLYAKAALKCKSCGDTCHDYAPGGCTGEANYKISEAYKTRVAFDGAYEAMRYFEKHICRPEEMTTEEAFKDFATAIRALKSGTGDTP